MENLNGTISPIADTNLTEAAVKRFFAPNQWPSKNLNLPNFKPSIDIYFHEMSKIAQKMFHLFSEVLKETDGVSKYQTFYKYDTPMSSFNLGTFHKRR